MSGIDSAPSIPEVATLPPPTPGARSSHLISRVLSPAVGLWLRSQVERVDSLQVHIEGSDRQLLSGHIPLITISAHHAVYQGLHLTEIALTGMNIRLNVRQIIRGKALRLLEVFPVTGYVRMGQADLDDSLRSPLLSEAVMELLQELLCFQLPDLLTGQNPELMLHSPHLSLGTDQLILGTQIRSANAHSGVIALRTGFQLVDGHTLQLTSPEWLPHPQAKRGLPITELQGFQIDLGSNVKLDALTLEKDQLVCRGMINITPAE